VSHRPVHRRTNDVELVVVEDAAAVANEVAQRLAGAVGEGRSVALTGGTTPEKAYECAAAVAPDWSGVDVWFGDERCVPPDHEDSNFGLANRALLNRLERPPRAVHRIRGELGKDRAAAAYDEELGAATLDLILLGIGPDGHVASLFPNAPTLDESRRRVVAAEPGHEPWVDRVSLTLPTLCAASEILFVLSGEAKAAAAQRAFAAAASRDTPASLVRAESGATTAILDRAAASALEA
jgi:6-phosphogluconolactonase